LELGTSALRTQQHSTCTTLHPTALLHFVACFFISTNFDTLKFPIYEREAVTEMHITMAMWFSKPNPKAVKKLRILLEKYVALYGSFTNLWDLSRHS